MKINAQHQMVIRLIASAFILFRSTIPLVKAQSELVSLYPLAALSHRNDTVWHNQNYTVFRNVRDFGARGDGIADDSDAIMQAMVTGGRCGGAANVCDSSTITPAIVYLPPGTYLVNKPIQMYYYTQIVGDPNDLPIVIAGSGFVGFAVIDADPYDANGQNWYTNQNNFFRQVRNLVIDVSQWSQGVGIHWQVAQATSLQNVVFEMDNTQTGLLIDNGSGGFMADLTFNNGYQGAFIGSQQFTSRNMTFNNCRTAIFVIWDWGWTFAGITVNGGVTALDMSTNPLNQSIGSVVLTDSKISGCTYGIRISYENNPLGAILVLNNVDLAGVQTGAVVDYKNETILQPGLVRAWSSHDGYEANNQGISRIKSGPTPSRASGDVSSLLNSDGHMFSKSRPQYRDYRRASFITAKTHGCAGDGVTDDTAAINSMLNTAAGTDNVVYFEHGAYLVKDTIRVPANVEITGECWPLIVADSKSFNDPNKPKPVIQVGAPGGERGAVRFSDLVFETNGPAPGAIMVQWNLQSDPGLSGMWDCHVRIGGSVGTRLGPRFCGTGLSHAEDRCEGVFLMFHASKPSSGVYLENTWFWVADHDLDSTARNYASNDPLHRLSLYSARGVLIQSSGPVWLWGTASEHSIMYNYQFDGVTALFSGFMQSETPYWQPNPPAPLPFAANAAYHDPDFATCSQNGAKAPCNSAWGLRILESQGIVIHGAGLYSFFQNYGQACVSSRNCQARMVEVVNSTVNFLTLSTANSVTIVNGDAGRILAQSNRNWFCDTIAFYAAR